MARSLCFATLICAAFMSPFARSSDPPKSDAGETGNDSIDAIRRAVNRAMPPLWEGMEEHNEKRSCFTCHNHGVSLLAMSTAKRHGFDIPADKLKEQIDFIVADLERNRPRFEKGQGPGPSPAGGETDNTGYSMFALHSVGHAPDALTKIVMDYTLANQKGRAYWHTPAGRFPTEASHFTTTALNVRALRNFATDSQKTLADQRIEAAKGWLLKTAAKDTEDRVFRLLGLKAAEAETKAIENATAELMKSQRAEGGWSQTDRLESDAYATGSALYALHIGGGIAVSNADWRRGLRYLLSTQKEDGTWHVKSRSRPIQKYYESGFPYEKDQFISCAASAWATTALALATPIKAAADK